MPGATPSTARANLARGGRIVLVLLGLGAWAIAFWTSIARNLDLPWTSIRLAPAFALARGLPLFSLPEQAPWVMVGYGPLYPVTYLPAVWARFPAEAVVSATLLAHLFVLLPVGLLCSLLRKPDARMAGEQAVAWGLPWLLFALVAHLAPSLAYATTSVHADAPAFGFFLLACYAILRAEGVETKRAGRWLMGAGVAVGLSAACKLNFLAGLVALGLWVLRFFGWKRALLLGVAAVAAVAAVYGVEMWRDGVAAVLLNLRLPGRMPWFTFSDVETMALNGYSEEFGEKARTFLIFGREYLRAYGAVALAIALVLAARRREAETPVAARLVGLFLYLALFLAPASIASIAKYGGDVNSRALVSLPLCLAALFALALAAERGNWAARLTAYAALAGATFMIALPARENAATLWPKTTPTMVEAYAVLSADPTGWYFPYDPLAHLLADGKFRPNIDVVYAYATIGQPVDEAAFRAALPENLRYLALPPSGTEWGVTELSRLLPEFHNPASDLTFARHRVYTR